MSATLKMRYPSSSPECSLDAGDDQQCLESYSHVPAFEAIDPDLVASRLAVMLSQESGPYSPPGDNLSSTRVSAAAAALGRPALAQRGKKKCVDVTCRTKMIDWCYTIVDYCKFDRGVVSAAFSLLDRYIATPAGSAVLFDRNRYQLASMTTLYTAVKMTEPEVMGPDIIAGLSRGSYSEEDVTKMEMDMLVALEWRTSSPTAVAFLRNFMVLLPDDAVDSQTRARVFDLATYQTELAVRDYDLSAGVRPSLVAYAALLNACAEAAPIDGRLPGFLNMIGVVANAFDSIVSEPCLSYLDDIRRSLLIKYVGDEHVKRPSSPSSVGVGIEAADAVSKAPSQRDVWLGLASCHCSSPRCVSQREKQVS